MQTFALVGESGSGKSVTAASILKLLPASARIQGSIRWKNCIISEFTDRQMQRIRGREIGWILQDPLSALNPVMSVGNQVREIIQFQCKCSKKQAVTQSKDLMEKVYLKPAGHYYSMYPHELSGGLRQRVLIALALAADPQLLIADEPTTALDVSVQKQILLLLKELKQKMKLSLLLITHDLGVVSQIAERVAVMYAGKIVEEASSRELFNNPMHPYTQMLINAIPGNRFVKEIPIKQSVTGSTASHFACPFYPRCPEAVEICRNEIPRLSLLKNGQKCACHKRSSSYES